MGYPARYHNPLGQRLGCCICARRNSSSRYIKWNVKFTEELFLEVFRLETMDGRRGYLCNPCVLVMKRYKNKRDAGVPPSKLPDYSWRVDFYKKKGSKRQLRAKDKSVGEAEDLDGEGNAGAGTSQSCTKTTLQGQKGYRYQEMTLRPRAVYTGRKKLHLRSKYQLVPAQSYEEDTSGQKEDDMTSESEVAHHRRITLKCGQKTLKQKAEEKAKRDAIEDQLLFGDPEEDPGYKGLQAKLNGLSIHARKEKSVPAPQRVVTRRQLAKKLDEKCDPDIDQQMNPPSEANSDSASMQDDVMETEEADAAEEADAENSVDSSCPSSNSQGTVNTQCSVREKADPSDVQAIKRKQKGGRVSLWNMADKEAIAKRLRDIDDKSMEPVDRSIDALEDELAPLPVKKKRVQKIPVRRLKRPKTSFFDRTYFQKFQLCCIPMYVGENQLFIMDTSKMSDCPKMREYFQRMPEKCEQKKGAASVSQSDSQSTSSKSVNMGFDGKLTCMGLGNHDRDSSELTRIGLSDHVPDSSESTCSESSETRALLPSPVGHQPPTANFHYCTLEASGSAKWKAFHAVKSAMNLKDLD